MPLERASLRGQLLRWLLVPLGVVWLSGAFIAYHLARNFAYTAFDRALVDTTRAVAAQVRHVDAHVTLDLPPAARDILQHDTRDDRFYYQVRTAQGQLVAGDSRLPVPDLGRPLSPSDPLLHDAELDGRPVRIAAVFMRVDGAPDGVLVQLAETVRKRDELEQEILSTIVVPQLLLILLAAVSVWYGVKRGLEPLRRAQEALTRRSHRDLRPVALEQAPDEVRPLLQATNDLLARLDTALKSQQRFIADAAHQLRTPLAGIKTQTELALRHNDLEAIRHTLQQLSVSADRVTRLANQLLALARAEPEGGGLNSTTVVDLVDLARRLTSDWVPEAVKKDIDLGYVAPERPVTIHGDAFLLQEMLANLIDNAIRYSPMHSHVTVRVGTESGPELVVEDNGPGIPSPDRDRVFERFYRVLGNDTVGSGLGLAIVREIALSHGAAVTLDEAGGGRGTRVSVRFPAA